MDVRSQCMSHPIPQPANTLQATVSPQLRPTISNGERDDCHSAENTWEVIVYKADDLVWLKSMGSRFAISDLYRGLDN